MAACDPPDLDSYNRKFMGNSGPVGLTQRFACPFCAEAGWYSVPFVEFGKQGETEPIACEHCGRAAKFVTDRSDGSVTMGVVQTAGEDPPSYLPPMPREEAS